MAGARWQLQEAKNRLSEVVRKAQHEGPQTITLHGKDAAVVVSAKEFARIPRRKGTLADFFRASPLLGVDLAITRSKDTGRKIDL
jgi:prevent-host-death family protein